MAAQQKITDSPIDFAEQIIDDVKNSKEEGVLKCVQCGMCTSTCPAARHSDYNPREIIERVLEGDVSIIEDENIWNCFYCYTCHSVCPVGNSVCEVNQILKQFAVSKGINYDKLYEYMGFADSYFTAAIGAIPEIFFEDIDRDVPGWWNFRQHLDEIRSELELDPPLMPPKDVIDEVSTILTITGFKDKIEKIRASQGGGKMKQVPDKDILLFRSCLVSVEYPGVEASTKFVFDKLGIDYAISEKQTCCTGLGHYSDVFNQIDTSAIGARNFKIAREIGRPNLVMMCATCYAINKKSVKLLNKKDDLRNHINQLFDENGLSHLKYEKDDLKPTENIFHVVDILYGKKDEIKDHIKYDLSDYRIATHHGCHYCKVHYEDTIGGVRDPNIIDELIEECGCKTIGWYDHKRATCGTGFRQRYSNPELSFTATADKMNAIADEDVDILVHLCPNCHIQFDRYQHLIGEREGRKFKAIHLNVAQFIALAMGGDFDKVIGAKAHTVPIDSIIKELKEVEK